MARKEVVAGISVTTESATLVVVEHGENETTLLHLDELQAGHDEFWYLNVFEQSPALRKLEINQVAVALNPNTLTLLKCPLDSMLNQSERNDHIHWELSHYIENYKLKEYVNDVHILRTRPQDNVQDVLVVSVRRDVIFGLQERLSRRGLTLGIVDVNHFATNAALLHSHNEVGRTTCAVVGFNGPRVDVSILNNGHMTDYEYWTSSAETDEKNFLQQALHQKSLDKIYLYGAQFTREYEQKIKTSFTSPTVAIEPFRGLQVSQDFTTFSRFVPNASQFAAAVGIALRKS